MVGVSCIFKIFASGHRLQRSIPLFLIDSIPTLPFDLHLRMDSSSGRPFSHDASLNMAKHSRIYSINVVSILNGQLVVSIFVLQVSVSNLIFHFRFILMFDSLGISAWVSKRPDDIGHEMLDYTDISESFYFINR